MSPSSFSLQSVAGQHAQPRCRLDISALQRSLFNTPPLLPFSSSTSLSVRLGALHASPVISAVASYLGLAPLHTSRVRNLSQCLPTRKPRDRKPSGARERRDMPPRVQNVAAESKRSVSFMGATSMPLRLVRVDYCTPAQPILLFVLACAVSGLSSQMFLGMPSAPSDRATGRHKTYLCHLTGPPRMHR